MIGRKNICLEEIPSRLSKKEIKEGISIYNPGKKEKDCREYVSKEITNGWKNQRFMTGDYPDVIPLIYTGKMEEDPGKKKKNPLFITSIITKPFNIYGRSGWFAWDEFNQIPRKLLAQRGIASIRCAKESDFEFIEIPKGKFWLSSPTFINDSEGRTNFFMRYKKKKKSEAANLYRQDGVEFGGELECGILAAISLNVEIRENESDIKARSLWEY